MSSFIIIALSIFFSAFFSGMEIAYLASNKLKLELDKKRNKFPSGVISLFLDNPAIYISTMLIGNNIALVVFGIETANLLEPVIYKYITVNSIAILLLQTIISTVVILVTAEFIPKSVFRNNANITLNAFAIPVLIFYIIFYPVSFFSIGVSKIIMHRIFNIKIDSESTNETFGKIDLDNFVSDIQTGNLHEKEDEHNFKIFQNALDFSEIKIRECIIPRTELVALPIEATIDDLKEEFVRTGFSKILIYRNSIDEIIGYVHHSELFKKPHEISPIIRDIHIVPETMSAKKLLSQFIKDQKSLSVVVDEFGGTAGIVTIEDILEEIFGEIEDEHDKTNLEEKKINDQEFIFSARFEIDYLNEKYKLNIKSTDEFETLAGLILYHHENIPRLNTTIVIDNIKFTILKVSSTRIDLVHLKILL